MLVATALFVRSEQQQQRQINKKLRGDFFRINVGLIIVRDPIAAFVPCLSHPTTDAELREKNPGELVQTKIKPRRCNVGCFFCIRVCQALLRRASPRCFTAGVTAPASLPASSGRRRRASKEEGKVLIVAETRLPKKKSVKLRL